MYIEEVAQIFKVQFENLILNQKKNEDEKSDCLWRLVQKIGEIVCHHDKLQYHHFNTQFAYICHKYDLPPVINQLIHNLNKGIYDQNTTQKYHCSIYVGAHLLSKIYNISFSNEVTREIPSIASLDLQEISANQAFLQNERVIILDYDKNERFLIVAIESLPTIKVQVFYDVIHINRVFRQGIERILQYCKLPIIAQLINIHVDEESKWTPELIIIEPDHLVDVTAIAESYIDEKPDPYRFLLRKLIPGISSEALLKGNIVNGFFDALVINPNLSFQELFKNVFKRNPLVLASYDDTHLKSLMMDVRNHYYNLKNVIEKDFVAEDIDPNHCFIEPTFYSPKLGIQGRLDLLCQRDFNDKRPIIIELKSGKTDGDQYHQIRMNHFCQTMLYDLLIKSTFGDDVVPANYILYSQTDKNSLRYKGSDIALQQSLIASRNQLLAVEKSLSNITTNNLDIPTIIDTDNINFVKSLNTITRNQWIKFQDKITKLSSLERKYYKANVGFMAREQQLAKIGVQSENGYNGVASFWLNSFEEKNDKFEILMHLELLSCEDNADAIILDLKRDDNANLANFRQGDIILLYPYFKEDYEKGYVNIRTQLFKSTLVSIDNQLVKVRLRSMPNSQILQLTKYWNIEHDILDSSFNAAYSNLYDFISSPSHQRSLLLGTKSPTNYSPISYDNWSNILTNNQKDVLNKIISSKDYFLLWGPPGTGKTSTIIHHLVKYWIENSDKKLLLLAFTNRAVDEMCESIENISDDIKRLYFRIGSRFSSDERFSSQLLDVKMNDVSNRDMLKQLFSEHRIVLATLASLNTKKEIFDLMSFDHVIIDEASQVIDAQIIGLLSKFKKITLIGDHKQLPSIVLQEKYNSKIIDEELNTVGINDLSESLFERLYRKAKGQNWTWAYGQLYEQGRMNDEIMEFPNEFFYENKLTSITAHQKTSNYLVTRADDFFSKTIADKRVLFFPIKNKTEEIYAKINEAEADKVNEIIVKLFELYAENDRLLTSTDIGVITPFRSQIACIKSKLNDQQIQVDTIERYQGAAKKIIIISLCVSNVLQLANITSITEEGLDRKLNVAITRAKEQLIMLGDPDVLSQNYLYKAFIDRYTYNA